MKSEADWRNTFVQCSVLILIITMIWSLICVSKGICPFGQMLLDIGDMSAQSVPLYTHLWDAMHGQKSLMFDWYTGLGNNMAGAVLHFGLISPFNVFFLFIKRSAIESSMSIYILIKLIAIGLSIRFVLRKWFSALSEWMCISFSLLYVFSVFNMQYYYAVMWLDVSFIFPLIMYGYFLLMNEKKSMHYIISLSIACMMSFQHTYMIFLMLLLLTGLLPLLSKVKYQNSLIKLLGATIISMMIAAWIWLPASLVILQSDRLSSENSISAIWDSVYIFFTAKWMKLLNLGIPLSLFIIYFRRNFRQKDSKFFGLIISMLCAPILLESTNILWHGGSYMGYTMRFAYMLSFWILIAGAYVCNKVLLSKLTGLNSLMTKTIGIASLLMLAVVTILQYFVLKSADQSVYKDEISSAVIILIIVISVIAGCGLWLNQKEIYEKFVFVITFCSIFTLAMNTIIVSGIKDNTYISMSCEAADDIDKDNLNPLIRIKSLDIELNHNYPLVMTKNAVSNYLAANSLRQMEEINKMGYAKVGLRMSDYGGTLFTDALLGVNEVITSGYANESLYQYEETYGNYNIYKSLYRYGQGIKLQNIAWDVNNQVDNPFIYQNQIAQKVLGGYGFLDVTISQNNEISIEIDKESILYLYAEHGEKLDTVSVTDVNTGENVIFKLHESGWMNGIVELGTWENTSLNIQALPYEQIGGISCAVLPLQSFVANEPDYFENYTVTQKVASLQILLDDAEEGDYLFLPLYHDNGWKCIVNNRRTCIEEFANYFIAIPLQGGKNEIELSFLPNGLLPGIVITLIGIILLAAVCIYLTEKEWVMANRVLFVFDEVIFGIIIIVFYIIPLLFLLKKLISAVLG